MVHAEVGRGPSEYGVTFNASTTKLQYSIAGWRAVAWGLALVAGSRLQLEPISRGPWRLRLTLLPPNSDEPPAPAAEALPSVSADEAMEEGSEDSSGPDSAAAPPDSAGELSM